MQYILNLKFIKLFAYNSARVIQTEREESHKHRCGYYYGFQIIYGGIIKILLLVLTSLLFRTLIPTLIVTFSFAIIRVFAGGLHFNSYTKCAYISLATLIFGGLITNYITYNNLFGISVFIFTLIVFLLYAPVENENRPLKNNDKVKFKIISMILLLVLFILQQYFVLLDINYVSMGITIGVLLSGLIATPVINKLK